ncbi:MAG: TonB-dependent receptor domain-containing protein, partial [Gemmatimonadota bacterium]
MFPAAALAALASLGLAAGLAAQGEVAGRVLDASSLEPMAGVQVSVPGTGLGTLTDEAGAFTLGGLTGAQATLRFQHLGYRTITRTVAIGTTDIEVQLTPEAIALDEIVVTGTAGERRARAIGNAVGRLNAEEITEVAPPLDVQGLIGARVSGVRIRDASGEVGTGGSTTIRGVGSLTLSSEPLVYVDGVRVNNEAVGDGVAFSGAFGRAGPSRINELNPADIESIEIIKGPAAATLYGTEASNGVIQIITKQGSRERPEFRLQVGQGVTYLPNPEEVFPTVWARDANGELTSLNIIENDIAQGLGSPFGTGHNQEYSASIAGGAEDVRYYVSGAFRRDEGIVPYNWENQLNARTNFTISPSPIVEANLNIGFLTSKVSAASAAQPITTHIIWGTPLLAETPNRGYLVSTPEAFEEDVEGEEDVDRTTISLNLTHDPFEWLDHRLTVGADISNIRSTLLCRRDLDGGQPCGIPAGLRSIDRERANLISVDYGVTARLSPIPDLVASTSLGAQFNRKKFEQEALAGEGLAIEDLESISATAGDQRSAEESFLENRTLGLFVQEQLSWKNRLFLTGALRGDDNSAFGKDFDFVTYPRFSASWVLSEEPFFDVGLFSTLRLRAAWG